MSTRATYEICRTTFYCHWDGYPTGAAQRFVAMIKAHTVANEGDSFDMIEQRRGGWPYAFIRGVMDAEPTRNHDEHGDTEFRYTISEAPNGELTIKVQERVGTWNFDKPSEWRVQYLGDLADWLNLHMRPSMAQRIRAHQQRFPAGQYAWPGDAEALALDEIPAIVRVDVPREYCTTAQVYYASLHEAEKIAANFSKKAEHFQPDNPNKKVYGDQASAWKNACGPKKDVDCMAD